MIEVNDEMYESGEDDNFGLSARSKYRMQKPVLYTSFLRNSRASRSAPVKCHSRKTVSK